MCRYYKHVWTCGHVRYVFAAYCTNAGLVQRPCGHKEVWQSLPVVRNEILGVTFLFSDSKNICPVLFGTTMVLL
jgi:hypothetical protein